MIRRLAVTTALTAAAASALVVGASSATSATPEIGLASMGTQLSWSPNDRGDRGHGPGWDGRHGNWDGRGGFGRGGGWDGNGGGWDGHRWWVSRQRCEAGHGRVAGFNDRRTGVYCRGGFFNGAPVRF
ncbi:MAG TPA: hypothetical protein VIQ30_00110 [Pseudonocardia sp.]|jgi:hypothetical protein